MYFFVFVCMYICAFYVHLNVLRYVCLRLHIGVSLNVCTFVSFCIWVFMVAGEDQKVILRCGASLCMCMCHFTCIPTTAYMKNSMRMRRATYGSAWDEAHAECHLLKT